MTALAQSVTIGQTVYFAGTDHTAMPASAVDAIRNPAAWVGGVAPDLSGQESERSLPLGDILASPARARAALGLNGIGAVTVTGSRTLTLADAGKVLESTSSSPVTVTVPDHATVTLPVGTVLEIAQYGTGQVTVAAAGGVLLRTPATLTSRARYSSIVLRKRAANEWMVGGDLT